MTEHLDAHHIIILTALRDAAALRREPKPLTPDGHERWFSLRQLDREGRLAGLPVAVFDPLARTLAKRGLVTRRTIQGTVLYALQEPARKMLERLEEWAGITELVAIDLETEQAREDIRQAQARERRALNRLRDLPRQVRPTFGALAAMNEEVTSS